MGNRRPRLPERIDRENGSLYANYKKFYQNVYPGNGPLSGAVNPADTAFNLAAYNHQTDRENSDQSDRLRLQGLHWADRPHAWLRDGICPAVGRPMSATPESFRTAPIRSSRIPLTPPISALSTSFTTLLLAPTPTASPRPTRTASTRSPPSRAISGYDRAHALAASAGWNSRRPFRPVRPGHEHQHPAGAGR